MRNFHFLHRVVPSSELWRCCCCCNRANNKIFHASSLLHPRSDIRANSRSVTRPAEEDSPHQRWHCQRQSGHWQRGWSGANENARRYLSLRCKSQILTHSQASFELQYDRNVARPPTRQSRKASDGVFACLHIVLLSTEDDSRRAILRAHRRPIPCHRAACIEAQGRSRRCWAEVMHIFEGLCIVVALCSAQMLYLYRQTAVSSWRKHWESKRDRTLTKTLAYGRVEKEKNMRCKKTVSLRNFSNRFNLDLFLN